jgi:hypothetical protein
LYGVKNIYPLTILDSFRLRKERKGLLKKDNSREMKQVVKMPGLQKITAPVGNRG